MPRSAPLSPSISPSRDVSAGWCCARPASRGQHRRGLKVSEVAPSKFEKARIGREDGQKPAGYPLLHQRGPKLWANKFRKADPKRIPFRRHRLRPTRRACLSIQIENRSHIRFGLSGPGRRIFHAGGSKVFYDALKVTWLAFFRMKCNIGADT